MPILTDNWAPAVTGWANTPRPGWGQSGAPGWPDAMSSWAGWGSGASGTGGLAGLVPTMRPFSDPFSPYGATATHTPTMRPFSDPNWRPPGSTGGLADLPNVLTHPPDPQWALTRHQINQTLALQEAQAAGDRQRVLAAQKLGLEQIRNNRSRDLTQNMDTLADTNLTGGFTQHYQQGGINQNWNQQRQNLNKETANALAAIANQMARDRLSAQQGLESGALAHQGYQQNNSYYINPGSMHGPGGKIVAVASHQLGVPYVWGGESHSGFDCSGLLYWSLNRSGIHVPRTTADGYMHMSHAVGRSQLRPGDAVFFHYSGPAGYASHVGIYIGNGKMIVAPHSGANVQIQTISWSGFLRGGRF